SPARPPWVHRNLPRRGSRQRRLGALRQALAVLALVVGPIVACANWLPPPAVLLVPGYRPLQSLGKAHERLPAECSDLRRGERVAAVVAGPVGDVLDQGLAGPRELDDSAHHLDVRALVGSPRVVDLTGGSVLEHVADRAGEVRRMDPVANLHAVAVHGQRVA